ncbi:MAG: pyridoxamine 5-phosphate oxidase [Paenibacillaceae bacterium]|jgi:flavin reductase (DIM6/NTAB) family NADH-FMN oxidoreductase RutF|nr:pyridoxamine 5-phosphate oxidase [Paenibacillaceae bacterium]
MAEASTALSDTVFTMLQKESFVLLSTIDHESGAPQVNAISWIYAVSPTRVRIALDQRSRILTNLQQHAQATLAFIAEGTVKSINGTTTIVKQQLDEVPIKLACIDLDIHSVRDAMFYGARIVTEPEYEKTYDKRAAERLDGQVFAAMRKA